MSDPRLDFFSAGAGPEENQPAADPRLDFFTNGAPEPAAVPSRFKSGSEPTVKGEQPELLPMLWEGGKEAAQSVLHGAGTVVDVATGTNPGKGSHAERYASLIDTDPSLGGRINPNPAISPEAISQTYDQAFGTGPAAQTFKERIPQAVEAIGTVVPVIKAGGAAGRAFAPRGTVEPPGAAPGAPQTAQDVLAAQQAGSQQNMGAAAAAPNVHATSPELQNAIVRGARQNGGALNPQAVGRHIEAETLPVPVRLTEGQALQDPGLLSNEQNLRGRHEDIRNRFDEQNKALSANVTALRDRVGPDVFSTNPVEHGDTLIEAYRQKDEPIKADITAKYKALEDANGGQFPLDTNGFVKSTDAALSKALKSNSVPSDLSATLNEFRNGRQMTFEDFESLRSDAADAARTSTDGRQRAAAGIIRDQLENMPLTPEAAKLKPLADAARSAARARFQALDADPAYEAAVHGTVPPDRFVQRFLTGPQATRDGVATIRQNLKENPVATQTMGVAALDHLRQAAGIDQMGNGNFSQAGFNKNLQVLGPRLNSLVDPKTAEDLSSLGNVARYTQFQPRGSFVNNSNTFVAAAAEHAKGAVEGAVNMKAGGIPVGSWVRNHFQTAAERKAVQRMLEPGAGITRLAPSTPGTPP